MSIISTLKLDPSQLEWVESSLKEILDRVMMVFHDAKSEFRWDPTSASLITACGLLSSLYYWNAYSFWSRRSVKTPPPIPPFGNFFSLFGTPLVTLLQNWREKYGRFYGIYLGTEPQLVCADANVLKRICIKDFDKFPNHQIAGVMNRYQKHFLIFQQDNLWRASRAILTPTFTSGKMKIIYKKLDNCTEKLIEDVRESMNEADGLKGVTINVRQLFGSLSMSSALSSFYGISLEGDDKDESKTAAGFAERVQNAFQARWPRSILYQLVPISVLKFLNIPLYGEKRFKFFADNANRIIAHRRKMNISGQSDFLQLLLQAKYDDKLEIADSDKMERHHTLLEDSGYTGMTDDFRPSNLRLTDEEVTCQAMFLMMVATETSAAMLAHTVYFLAEYQQVQQRLYEEVSKIVVFDNSTKSHKFDYEQLTSCQYLDCVLSESLRMMGPVTTLDRIASEDYYVEEYDFTIPKGTLIAIAFQAIHMDPEYWPEPNKFDPDRFLPENKRNIVPGSYCPFGIGPRSCIGYRFALTEGKVALAKLICEFSFHRATGSVFPPIPVPLSLILNENKNLIVTLRSR